jgi:hypothetical protein
MSRLKRNKRTDVWKNKFLEIDRAINAFKSIWRLNDDEASFLLQNMGENSPSVTKPMHLNIANKKIALTIVENLLGQYYELKKGKQNKSILHRAEEVQKAAFDFGNYLLALEAFTSKRLKFYGIRVVRLVVPFEWILYRKADNKTITSFQIAFDEYSYIDRNMKEVIKESQWQECFAAEKEVIQEFNYLISEIGFPLEHYFAMNHSKKAKPMDAPFNADVNMDCLTILFNELVEKRYRNEPIDENLLIEFNHYWNQLYLEGWKLNSPFWKRIIVLFIKQISNDLQVKSTIDYSDLLINFETNEEINREIILEIRKLKEVYHGNGFTVFSYQLKEYSYYPSKETTLKLEEIFRDNCNYWTYE